MDDSKNFEVVLEKALRSIGYDLPKTEEEVVNSKRSLNDEEIPPIPESIDNPLKIINQELITKVPLKIKRLNMEVEQNLARAAREGNEISEDVKRQMQKDRKRAEEENLD